MLNAFLYCLETWKSPNFTFCHNLQAVDPIILLKPCLDVLGRYVLVSFCVFFQRLLAPHIFLTVAPTGVSFIYLFIWGASCRSSSQRTIFTFWWVFGVWRWCNFRSKDAAGKTNYENNLVLQSRRSAGHKHVAEHIFLVSKQWTLWKSEAGSVFSLESGGYTRKIVWESYLKLAEMLKGSPHKVLHLNFSLFLPPCCFFCFVSAHMRAQF